MNSEYCILLTTHNEKSWEPADQVITQGILALLPELQRFEIKYSVDFENKTDAELLELVRGARCVIQAGTPSWMRQRSRRFWHICTDLKKSIWFLGIGTGVHYFNSFWYGAEDFMALRDSGLIEKIICRDKFSFYWLHHRLGFDSGKISVLPCPAFYVFEPFLKRKKTSIVLSIPNPEETAHQTAEAFWGWKEKFKYIMTEMERAGAQVSLCYQRCGNFPFIKAAGDFFGREIKQFDQFTDFESFMTSQDVYIGVRNHGAVPCAGAGLPSLLLGTDLRQFISDEIPGIFRIDISHVDWNPAWVFDWYFSLDMGAGAASQMLLNYRSATKQRWREQLKKLIEILQ